MPPAAEAIESALRDMVVRQLIGALVLAEPDQ
jgi:hypothetical protein